MASIFLIVKKYIIYLAVFGKLKQKEKKKKKGDPQLVWDLLLVTGAGLGGLIDGSVKDHDHTE